MNEGALTPFGVSSLIEETRELWNQGKKVMIQVAYNLTKIRDADVWKQEHQTFAKFCDAELGIGQSQTSKLLAIADYYLDKFSPEEIGPVDYELLYASTKLEGSVEENLSKARTLTRDDLKKEKAEASPHTAIWVTYCDVCKLSQSNHAPEV